MNTVLKSRRGILPRFSECAEAAGSRFYFWVPVVWILIGSYVLQADPMTNRPAHHTDKGFKNPWVTSSGRFGDFLKWRFGKGPKEKAIIPEKNATVFSPAIVNPDIRQITNPPAGSVQATWLGQSTFLLQVDGVNILTDPHFSLRASPIGFAGPERQSPIPLDITNLPSIDYVVISHNHYDHLDKSTIKALGNTPKYIVPLKLAKWFSALDITNVVELDWWQKYPATGIDIISVPAQHFSSRGLGDRNKTLWCGFVIQTIQGAVYFAGDSGCGPFFKEIGEKYGPFMLSMIPVGAYRPRWFMKPVHLDPPEAVQVHKDVRSELTIGMHWGTFKLSDEPLGEPLVYVRKAIKEAGIGTNEFLMLKAGEMVEVVE